MLLKRVYIFLFHCVCTLVLVRVHKEVGLAGEGGGDPLSRRRKVLGAVGAGGQGVEGVVADPPHGALVRGQLRRAVLTIPTHKQDACQPTEQRLPGTDTGTVTAVTWSDRIKP